MLSRLSHMIGLSTEIYSQIGPKSDRPQNSQIGLKSDRPHFFYFLYSFFIFFFFNAACILLKNNCVTVCTCNCMGHMRFFTCVTNKQRILQHTYTCIFFYNACTKKSCYNKFKQLYSHNDIKGFYVFFFFL
jgi:hypothetical protein